MPLRAIAVLVLAVGLVLGQLLASAAADQRIGSPTTTAAAILTRSVAAQDDNDNENGNGNDNNDDDDDDDDDVDGDDDDGDNTDDGDGDNADDGDGDNAGDDDDDDDDDTDDDDDDDDTDDNDNGDDGDDDNDNGNEVDDGDDDNDNGSDADDGDDDNDNAAPDVQVVTAPAAPDATPIPTRIPVTPTPTPRPTRTPTPPPARTTEAQDVTNGQDLTLTLTGDRVVVQVFSSMPPGITLRLYLVEPAAHQPLPGAVVGDLMFRIGARDASGALLPTLPTEVNLTVRYQDADLDGRDDALVTLVRLDPVDNQWKTAPRLLTDPATNFVAASFSDLGVYAVSVP